MPEKVSVVTLGCEKNRVESEIMSGLVHQLKSPIMSGCLSQFEAPEMHGEVHIAGGRAKFGEIRRVRITYAYEYDLSGEGIA
jgi:hypothetical protein